MVGDIVGDGGRTAPSAAPLGPTGRGGRLTESCTASQNLEVTHAIRTSRPFKVHGDDRPYRKLRRHSGDDGEIEVLWSHNRLPWFHRPAEGEHERCPAE